MQFFIVDAFTDQPFCGNPAGVVLLDNGTDFPSDEWMRLVAAELRYSETAFVRRDAPDAFTTRYFTPKGEVDLCGHATIAAFGTMRQMGLLADGAICHNHTLAGTLEVSVGGIVLMQMAQPVMSDAQVDVGRLHRIMAGDAALQWPEWPVEIVSTGLPDIIMPVGSPGALHRLAPDMDALSALSGELGVIGVHAFAIAGDGYTAHVRNFAPLYGVPEESATGTANAALTHYLQRRGLLAPGSSCRFLQGEAMQRPSVVQTSIADDGRIFVGGQCHILARGTIFASSK